MAKKPLAFSPSEPDALGIEVQRLDNQHVLLSMAAHSHEFLEIIYFESGGGQYQYENRVWDVSPGDLFLTAPYETHDASKITIAKGWVTLFTAASVNLTGLETSSYLNWMGSPLFLAFTKNSVSESRYLNIAETARPQWSQRFERLSQELDQKPFGYREMARSLLTQMLIEITRLTMLTSDSPSNGTSPLLIKIFDFIEHHYQESISLDDLAKEVNHSPSYLSAAVRKLTGRTVLEWIRERRMAEARRLLLETDEGIVQIAEASGYPEVTYFIRHFRQFHGKTPQVWRQIHH
ncbi:MAG: AraC family transcriptional regulator [Leptolyngbyaceae bacterium]|nr:AraC family transcriptional regulator [Leptolyngbyaceae bacterium]